jgi:nucleoid DNA-binding protein
MSTKLEVDFMETCDTNENAQAAYVSNDIGTKLLGLDTDLSADTGAGYACFNKFIATAGTTNAIKAWCRTSSNVKLALYSDNAGEPGTLLASTTAAFTAGSLNSASISNVTLTNGVSYWLGVNVETSGGVSYESLSGTGIRRWKQIAYADWTFPSTYDGTGFSSDTGRHGLSAYFIPFLQSYSEATIKTQGSYALKAVAAITDSLNKTLTKTFASPLDLSGVNTLKLDMRATRTGSNIKLGLHNNITSNILTGGTTTTDSEYSASYITAYSDDGNINTRWASGATFPHWWKYDFGSGVTKVVTKLRMYTYSSGSYDTVKNFNVQGSNNDSTWTTLYTGIGIQTTSSLWQEFIFNNINYYRYYKINFIDTWSGSETTMSIWEIEMMEGVFTEFIPTIITADTYETKTWDISAVADADKNAIDTFTITLTNADVANTVYFDNFGINQGTTIIDVFGWVA